MVNEETFQMSERWRSTYPDARAGILVVRDLANPNHHPGLEARKGELETELRQRLAGLDATSLKALEPVAAYNAYYKRFKKTYHVQLQLESVALNGKSIPSVAALVEAMFMAELKNLLLTAGHDLAEVRLPVTLDVATGNEHYVRINGQEQVLKARDMMISDGEGVISSIIYGPDQRTRIKSDTREALFTVYAPSGISEQAVNEHLQDIYQYILIFAPEATIELMKVY